MRTYLSLCAGRELSDINLRRPDGIHRRGQQPERRGDAGNPRQPDARFNHAVAEIEAGGGGGDARGVRVSGAFDRNRCCFPVNPQHSVADRGIARIEGRVVHIRVVGLAVARPKPPQFHPDLRIEIDAVKFLGENQPPGTANRWLRLGRGEKRCRKQNGGK